ncbi:hypothetical protein [Streptomyces sp. CME 23]|uniref:hypothetical protein n=1 Tax=Streptomyces gilvus TaxID=2920937 RepID=UPI001F0FB2F0|nr:hypothetical protein [Streptomyces sp. CME 23]MCH5677319.1 hypothetical protein [Streptomyces sp. CME 23]
MSREAFRTGPAAGSAPGALLLCRAVPESVVPAAQLLREDMLLTRAGDDWSVLVPEGTPWLTGGEPVDRVLTGWATALAVGAPWPVLALWWDADRAGYVLASGFRRPVGYVWLANGTPAGEDEAMHTFAARLGLDPVLDVQALDRLTEPARLADARARLRALLAVLTRAGVSLPEGMAPGDPTDRLREAAGAAPDARPVEWPGKRGTPAAHPKTTDASLEATGGSMAGASLEAAGQRPDPTGVPPEETGVRPGWSGASLEAAGASLAGASLEATGAHPEATEAVRPAPWLPWPGTPGSRALALAQVAAGIPLTVWGVRRRSAGWITAGTLLLAHGALGLTYETVWPWD